jgi:hypothetical protein
MNDIVVMDGESLRRMDENGYLHVSESALTKEQVAPYRGDEIPGWQKLGLDPDRVYQVYRPAEELKKAVETFNGLPILLRHKEDSAWNPQKALRVGTTGTSAVFDGRYIKNALVFHDAEAIDLIESGKQKELSPGYRYTPLLQAGVFEGQPYDIIMINPRGNHMALVKEGRSGPDVVVADSALFGTIKGGLMQVKALAKAVAARLRGNPKLAQDGDVDKVEALLTEAVAELAAEEGGTPKEPAVELDGQDDPSQGSQPPAAAPASGREQAKDEDMTAKLATLLAPLLEGKTEVAGKAVQDWLAELAAALATPAATDEGGAAGEANKEIAKDAKLKGNIGTLTVRLDGTTLRNGGLRPPQSPPGRAGQSPAASLAQDAAMIAGNLERDLAARYRAKEQAAQDIKPLVGEVSAMAFDSADAIYAYAVERMGLKPANYPGAALKGIVAGLVDARRSQVLTSSGKGGLAQDAMGGKSGPLGDLDLSRFTVNS